MWLSLFPKCQNMSLLFSCGLICCVFDMFHIKAMLSFLLFFIIFPALFPFFFPSSRPWFCQVTHSQEPAAVPAHHYLGPSSSEQCVLTSLCSQLRQTYLNQMVSCLQHFINFMGWPAGTSARLFFLAGTTYWPPSDSTPSSVYATSSAMARCAWDFSGCAITASHFITQTRGFNSQ